LKVSEREQVYVEKVVHDSIQVKCRLKIWDFDLNL
jgi:hypothetical protein